MKFSSLFSGAGGFDLGLEEAGHELIFLCESDPGARQVLKEKFPGVRLSHDVCSVEALPEVRLGGLGSVEDQDACTLYLNRYDGVIVETELVVAGFPCIDVSRAGLRRGLDGQSTGLVRHVFRLLRVAQANRRPIPWVLLENVEALLDRVDDQPPAIAFVVQQLMDIGFRSWAYRVVSSAGFGVPMRRRRVFILASIHGDARDVLLSQGMQPCLGACVQLFEGHPCYKCHRKKLQQRNSNDDVSFAIDLAQAMCKPGEDVVPSFTTSNDRMLLLLADGRTGMLRVEDGERLQGFPEGWTRSCFPVTGEGVSAHKRLFAKELDLESHNSRRWQLLGNAVTVRVARWLGERLMQPYSLKYRLANGNYSMQELLYEGKKYERGEENTHKRKRQNVWSFVTADEIQEAALFSFKDSSEYRAASLKVIEHREAMEKENPEKTPKRVRGNRRREAETTVPLIDTPEKGAEDIRQLNTISKEEAMLMQPYKEIFQAKMYKKIKKGIVQSSSKEKSQPPEKTWPKCAWWQKDIGCFAVTKCSDHPVICPFETLDTFITQVGRNPTSEERAGYVHRLKEKGWDICEEVLERISGSRKNGLASKSVELTRINELLNDSEMVGDIVWAPDSISEIHWPGEVLDPAHMPLGRSLPKECIARLTSEQKRASIPSLNSSWDQNDHAKSDHRRVLVLFFPVNNGKWQWYHPNDLLSWEDNRAEYEKKAHAAMKRANFKYKETLNQSLQDAKASHGVKVNKSSITTDKMRQTRAAAAAASVDLKSRCGRCRTCMNAYVGTKRHDCLTQRMTASALGGHAGAQLAICGENAIGARIAVWWDGDEEYFHGVICWYDPVSTEHTVAYDDGEIGMHRLWQHDEHILICSEIQDWTTEAIAVRDRLKKAMQEPLTETMSAEEILNNKRASELAARMPQLTDYEIERQNKVNEIRDKFKLFVGIDT